MIYDQMADIAEFAYENGNVQVSFEQMYSPHQPPFTIRGTKDFLKNIYAINRKPVCVTIDVGHMTGQRKFLMPSEESIKDALLNNSKIWLGSDQAYRMFDEAVCCINEAHKKELTNKIISDMNAHGYLFSTIEDSDVYGWLKELACYSPIIHMQQTDGITARHAAFTPTLNKNGIIKGNAMLKAIKQSYDQDENKYLQEPVRDIYLSFELFFCKYGDKEGDYNET